MNLDPSMGMPNDIFFRLTKSVWRYDTICLADTDRNPLYDHITDNLNW